MRDVKVKDLMSAHLDIPGRVGRMAAESGTK